VFREALEPLLHVGHLEDLLAVGHGQTEVGRHHVAQHRRVVEAGDQHAHGVRDRPALLGKLEELRTHVAVQRLEVE